MYNYISRLRIKLQVQIDTCVYTELRLRLHKYDYMYMACLRMHANKYSIRHAEYTSCAYGVYSMFELV